MMKETDLGLQETNVVYGETFAYGELLFRYESERKLTLTCEDCVIEIDFDETQALFGDLFFNGNAGSYYLHGGKIVRLTE